MSKWILCTEEMPKKEVGKIVWFSFLGESPDTNWCGMFIYRPGTGWTCLDNDNDYVFTLIDYLTPPVAWMPADIPVPYSVETETKKKLDSIIEKVNTDILEGNKKVSIADLYKDYLNIDFCKDRAMDLFPECFVDPEHWGWDKNGFHDLTKECAQIPLVHMKDIYSGIMDGIKTDNDESVPFDLDGDIFYYTFAGKGPYKVAINLKTIYLNGFHDGLERVKNAANDE